MRNLTFSDIERLALRPAESEAAFQMDEEAFRAFYDRTARAVWLYLSRLSGDAQLADDLLQETYYRFLRIERAYEDEAHRRKYLFRIATNLVLDGRRTRLRMPVVPVPSEDSPDAANVIGSHADEVARRTDLSLAMARLKPKDRALLWLAYVHGSSHREIAASLGLKASSIKLLLFRARKRLAALLRSPR
jgi:RNA polymerase sigma-70 factor, ECF subfamily